MNKTLEQEENTNGCLIKASSTDGLVDEAFLNYSEIGFSFTVEPNRHSSFFYDEKEAKMKVEQYLELYPEDHEKIIFKIIRVNYQSKETYTVLDEKPEKI